MTLDLRYEPFLTRIEVLRGRLNDEPTGEASWVVTVDTSQVALGIYLFAGILRLSGEAGFGQALVHAASLAPDDDRSERYTVDQVVEWATTYGCTEAMYDLARRSINMQTAVMDFTLDFPIKAPDGKVEIVNPDPTMHS